MNVDVPFRRLSLDKLRANFHRLHRRQFGFSDSLSEVEIVNIRELAELRRRKPILPHLVTKRRSHTFKTDSAQIFALGGWREARFVSREALIPGDEGTGPTVLEEATATSYIPPGWKFRVHEAGHIEVRRD